MSTVVFTLGRITDQCMAVSLPMRSLDQKSLVFSEKVNGKLRPFVGSTHTPCPGVKLMWM